MSRARIHRIYFSKGLKGVVFDSETRNGTLRIYRIIKWLDFTPK